MKHEGIGKIGERGRLMREILVVREFDNFSRILSESGLKVINCPTIEVAPLEDLSDFEAKLDVN